MSRPKDPEGLLRFKTEIFRRATRRSPTHVTITEGECPDLVEQLAYLSAKYKTLTAKKNGWDQTTVQVALEELKDNQEQMNLL